jgi:hypothetical protein
MGLEAIVNLGKKQKRVKQISTGMATLVTKLSFVTRVAISDILLNSLPAISVRYYYETR